MLLLKDIRKLFVAVVCLDSLAYVWKQYSRGVKWSLWSVCDRYGTPIASRIYPSRRTGATLATWHIAAFCKCWSTLYLLSLHNFSCRISMIDLPTFSMIGFPSCNGMSNADCLQTTIKYEKNLKIKEASMFAFINLCECSSSTTNFLHKEPDGCILTDLPLGMYTSKWFNRILRIYQLQFYIANLY